MRFDEFVAREHIEVLPADRFVGFPVGVELPPEWEQVDAKNGLRVWVWASDPRRKDFCGNAVLNLYRVQAVVEPSVLFAMLCEQQRQSVPNSRELLSDLAAATEGPGAAGTVVTVDGRLREFGDMVNAGFGEPKLSWPSATTYFTPHHRVEQVTIHRNYITTPRHGKLPIRLVQPREESRYADALKR